MDLEVARKSLAKRSAFSTKRIAFGVVAGLMLVAGFAWRASHYFGQTPAESEPAAVEAPAPAFVPAPEAAPPPLATTTESIAKTPPVTQQATPTPSEPAATQQTTPTANEPAGQAGDAAEQTKPEEEAVGQPAQAELPGSGMILVSRKPVSVLASPSASAPAMYGFPAGRPFRVIGREGGFVQIQDLRSSASGWIDESALAAPPAPAVAAPSQSTPGAVRKPATVSADPKPKAVKKGAPTVADTEPPEPDPPQARRSPGLFGRGGLFGGIFGNDN
jgi:hypothetical protein